MAKKGGVQLLQADINTDEEFEKFLERPGLLVMDVYTEWCGPCVGMVGSLKKIKLEIGGDNLHLAICKSDNIEALKRFRNKSEPTWLFASNGKSVNIMFGTNVPKLVKLITEELEIDIAHREGTGNVDRIFYEITERLPLEVEMLSVITAAAEKTVKIEAEAAEKKRRDYIKHFTDQINLNLPDLGVTIFGPHINREIFKKLIDPADSFSLSCKDRKVITITPDCCEILFFECVNPLEKPVLEYIFNKELLICLWKTADNETKPTEEILTSLVEVLTQVEPIMDEFGNPNPDQSLPAIIQPLEIVVEKKLELIDIQEKLEAKKKLHAEKEKKAAYDEENEEEDDNGNEHVEPEEPIATPEPEKAIIPGVWTPGSQRNNAAAIYLFFRQQTEHFLPPDPIPEPPHLAIVFDAYKRKDIIEICDQFRPDILSYGYFSNADPDTAQLVANSTKNYELKAQYAVTDKLVLKVAKTESNAILDFAANGPCYISQNTVDGFTECLKFFPEGYKTGEVEEEELAKVVATVGKKKKKKKKKVDEQSEGVGTVVSEAELEDPGEIDGEDDGNGDEDEDGKENSGAGE